jgi:hypothetical protein
MQHAFELLGYILLVKGCGRCWPAGFSRLEWKYPAGSGDCSEKPGLHLKCVLQLTAPNYLHSFSIKAVDNYFCIKF